MKKMFTQSCIWFLVLSLVLPIGGFAQDTELAPPVFRQEELDQMLAPIALYADSLLIQVLIAATYPLEVVQAARWVETNPNLKDEKLAAALEQKLWDPSVKSLVNFPSVLAMMNDKLEWTQNLGDAFLGQKDQVIASIQELRSKAHAQGNLKTTSEQVVVVNEEEIVIEPANPQVVYVPAYNPALVYGPWWYPAYPPYYYYPRGFAVANVGVISFGVGIACGAAWGYAWGNVHWANRHVYVNPTQNIRIYNNYYSRPLPAPFPGYRPGPAPGHGPKPAPGPHPGSGFSQWRHDPGHRKGVAYKDPNVHQQFGQTGNAGAEARKNLRGFDQVRQNQPSNFRDPSGQPALPSSNRPASQRRTDAPGQDVQRQDRQPFGQRKSAADLNDAGGGRQFKGKGGDGSQLERSSAPQNRSSSAIENFNRSGTEVRKQSDRGRSSRESLPIQNPAQSFQGGKSNQAGSLPIPGSSGRGAPNTSGGGAPKIGTGASAPKTGSGNVPNMDTGGFPHGGGGGGNFTRGGFRGN